jgi:hypothetical protein
MKTSITQSLLLAGLLAVAGFANAQSTSVPATVSTDTDISAKDQIRQGAHGQNKASATTRVPGRAGEATTMVKGNPNADPDSPLLNKSKSEIKSEKAIKKAERKQRRETAIMGQKGAQAGAPAGTPAVAPAGTPPVFEGGTPK